MEKENYYGGLKIETLKKLLKEKGAKVSGRKAELVERLLFYDKNNNFGYQPVIKNDETIKTPSIECYKDINSSSPIPSLTFKHLNMFIQKFNIKIDSANKMYTNGFLQYIRYCTEDEKYFVKGSCKAEMKKYMQYKVDISFSMDGEIQDSYCDCPVGQSINAHCKHVVVLLLAVIDLYANKDVILERTCTEKLQTFHRPSKKYKGSPMKAVQFQQRTPAYVFNNYSEDYKIWYKDYFRNTVIARSFNSNMSIKQTIYPANLYAVDWDHSFYTKETNQYRLLKSLKLIDVSQEDIAEIEFSTRGQSKSSLWRTERAVRLTASNFHSCCMCNSDGAKAKVQRIMNPIKFSSKATDHGNIYEEVAINKWNEINGNHLNIQECGLFISMERPYIGASPDALLAVDSTIEVKCPYVSRYRMIDEITVPYLERDAHNNLTLKKIIHIIIKYKDNWL